MLTHEYLIASWPSKPGLYWLYGYIHEGAENIPRFYIIIVWNDLHAQVYQTGIYLERTHVGGIWTPLQIPPLEGLWETHTTTKLSH